MRLPKRRPKRKPRGRHPLNALTPAFVRNVNQAGRYCDGHGLYLDVRPTGSRGWIQRLTIRGRRTELGLGGFPLVSLKEAREKAFANRKLAHDGDDPRAEKRRAESMPTFADAACTFLKQLRPGWRSPRHARLLAAQISLRNSRRLEAAMRSSRLPTIKTLAEFDVSFQPSIKREQIDSLHELGFVERRENIVFLGPTGVGKTHLAISLAINAAESGRKIYFGTLTDLVDSLEEAKAAGRLDRRLKTLTFSMAIDT